jgi:hypothetical protein
MKAHGLKLSFLTVAVDIAFTDIDPLKPAQTLERG